MQFVLIMPLLITMFTQFSTTLNKHSVYVCRDVSDGPFQFNAVISLTPTLLKQHFHGQQA